MTRKSLALLISLLLVLFWVPGLIASSPAHADAGSSIPHSPYNGGDGTIPDSNGSIHSTTDPVGSSDTTSFTGGKEDDQCPGVTTQGLASPKDDLTKVYIGSETVSGDVFLYLAWERSTTTGTTTIDFELNQATGALAQCNGVNPERTQGDLLFSYDFSNGGGSVVVNYFTWDTSLNKGAGGWSAQGEITGLKHNGDAVVEAATDNTGIKGEMAVDLTLLPGVFTATTCKDFGAAWAKTRSSTSFTSEIKDYVTPQPSIISNCAPIQILKEDSGTTPLAGATFSIAPAILGTDPAVSADQTPCTTRSDGFCYVPIAGSNPPAFAKPLLFPGNYTVREETAPAGYLLASPRSAPVTVPQTFNPATNAGAAVFHDPLGSIEFFKVDGDHHALGGAQFRVHLDSDGSDTTNDVLVTDDGANDTTGAGNAAVAGTITVGNLKTGAYDVTEETPPTGYIKDTSTKTATIGDPQVNAANVAHPVIPLTNAFVDNKKTTSLSVHKFHTETNLTQTNIGGAVFNLYETANTVTLESFSTGSATLVGSCTTNANGLCSVGDATHIVTWDHNYFWVEQSVPFPYSVPAAHTYGPIHITATNVDQTHDVTQADDPRAGISTTATASATLPLAAGTGISDVAHLVNVGASAAGTILFQAYGPGTACDVTPAFTSNYIPVSGPNNYTSNVFTPTTAGTYKWVATYYPDFNGTTGLKTNFIAGSCTDDGETSVVHGASPTLTTVATDTNTVDGTFHDVATLHNFAAPSQTLSVTFTLYTTATCDTGTDVFTSTNDVDPATGVATSGSFTADNTTGTYYWKATLNLNGDVNNTTTNIGNNCGSTQEPNREVSNAPVIPTPTKSPATGTVGVYAPDNTITYTVTVQNTGLATATNVSVTDPIDEHATFKSNLSCTGFVSATCDFSQPSGVPTWTFDLAAGGTVTIQFSVTANPDDVDGQDIFNTATAHNGHVNVDTNTTDHKVIRPILALDKNANPLPVEDAAAGGGTVSPGQTITYTLPLSNTGSAAANGVVATDQVPAHTSYDATNGAHCTVHNSSTPVACNAVEGGDPATVTWTVDVPANTTIDLVFSVVVDGQAALTDGQSIPNQGHFTWTYSDASNGPNLSGDSRLIHHVVTFAILTLAKSSSPESGSVVQRGDRIDYTVTLTNTGSAPATRTITDTLPGHVTLIAGTDLPTFTTNNGSVVTWLVTVPAATVGEGGTVPGTVSVTYAVRVNSDAPEGATLTNVALVDGQCVGNADASACTTDHHVPTGALTLVKHVDKTTASYGDTLTYTFTAGTTGALDQTNVVVHDVLPKGTAYVNGSAACTDAGTCTTSFNATNRTVTWALGNMAAGTARHLVFKVTIVTPSFDPTVGLPPETIVNSGTISSTETPTTPSNQVTTKVVTVLGVKIVRPPKLPFTGVPAQEMLLAGLAMLGAGIILTSVRRRREH